MGYGHLLPHPHNKLANAVQVGLNRLDQLATFSSRRIWNRARFLFGFEVEARPYKEIAMDTTPSPTRELLAVPDIGGDGVQCSILFRYLSPATQQAIRQARTESEKVDLAALEGDALPVVAQMHEHFVLGPARRKAQGMAYPTLASLDSFPLPHLLKESDRRWIRPGQHVTKVQGQCMAGKWSVIVTYADGVRLSTDPLSTRDECMATLRRIEQAVNILF